MTMGFRPPTVEEEPPVWTEDPSHWYDPFLCVYTVALPGWMWLLFVVPAVLALLGIAEFRFGS